MSSDHALVASYRDACSAGLGVPRPPLGRPLQPSLLGGVGDFKPRTQNNDVQRSPVEYITSHGHAGLHTVIEQVVFTGPLQREAQVSCPGRESGPLNIHERNLYLLDRMMRRAVSSL